LAQSPEDYISQRARDYGFELCRFTTPERIHAAAPRLAAFIANGYHGEMQWLADTLERRRNPKALWADCRSVIMLGANYGDGADGDPLDRLGERSRGVIARYAKGRDYHDVVKGRLKQVAGGIAARTGAEVKVFVDTAPLLEKPLAEAAGLGWQGKHTNLVSRAFGSWLLLGAILTDAILAPDTPEGDHCGSCRRCLDICPTDAFPAPYQLDARRCIAYLTIEYDGHIPERFREAIGNRVFGCDDCLAVCPWNKYAARAAEERFAARLETDDPPLADLMAMDEAAFHARFRGTPVKRTGRDRLMRNVLIAAGNSGDGTLLPLVIRRLDDDAAIVRAMAVWAMGRLAPAEQAGREKARRAAREHDPAVREEWASIASCQRTGASS
jgi:epoxyqueuosine reductase